MRSPRHSHTRTRALDDQPSPQAKYCFPYKPTRTTHHTWRTDRRIQRMRTMVRGLSSSDPTLGLRLATLREQVGTVSIGMVPVGFGFDVHLLQDDACETEIPGSHIAARRPKNQIERPRAIATRSRSCKCTGCPALQRHIVLLCYGTLRTSGCLE
jgi:hypothetical protein